MLKAINDIGGIIYNDDSNSICNVCIISSPMIRTIMTSDIIAKMLGISHKCILVEPYLIEGYQYMRGYNDGEPRPGYYY